MGNHGLYAYGSGLVVPGPVGAWAMRHLATEIWHDFFLDPHTASGPGQRWAGGCSAKAMFRTDPAVSHEDPALLGGLAACTGPALVLYGDYDIFGTSVGIVRRRLPHATQVTLEHPGHLSWLQNEPGYRQALRHFYSAALSPVLGG